MIRNLFNNSNLRKAFVNTVIGAMLSSLGAILAGGVFPSGEHWKIIVTTALVAGISQLIRSAPQKDEPEESTKSVE